ncbi:DUF6241 domain-containing protein [Evansella cellulosilytica]|uniref:Uncharacterized protein n=1 Tax=Evansella cellulosilytica (strain ATCC 21833 / DSM 2522 / FERM P-1141 / JCM 9156 / N-4) TaxID=649639 RepID=E6TYA9_EVAC2|nr:DUF6241 domain-containing protein [Evansella cellulosilytica]ADU28847.1 hypothetical protein Bcell_0565 [Evansella cellulosilytica DSM 2522]
MNRMQVVSIVLLVIVLIAVAAYSFLGNEDRNDVHVSDKNEDVEEIIISEPAEEEVIVGNVPTKEEVEEEFPLNLPEHAVQNFIHWMSHQKVAADQKWGKMLITDERITRIIEVIEANNYDHEDVYTSILTRWQVGDFSQAVEDHNTIWRLQNGTIGEATRLLTPEEERQYIEKNFE